MNIISLLASILVINYMNIYQAKGNIKGNIGISQDYLVSSLTDIDKLCDTLCENNFTYDIELTKNDKQLTPSTAYQKLINGFSGDCDDWANALYHILSNNNINSYFACIWSKNKVNNHISLVFEYEKDYYINNYNYNFKVGDTLDKANEYCKKIWQVKFGDSEYIRDIIYFKYSYTTGLFYLG